MSTYVWLCFYVCLLSTVTQEEQTTSVDRDVTAEGSWTVVIDKKKERVPDWTARPARASRSAGRVWMDRWYGTSGFQRTAWW